MSKFNDPTAITALLAKLAKLENSLEIIQALQDRRQRGWRGIESVLHAKNPTVRANALRVLQVIRGDAATDEALISALDDPAPAVREIATEAVANVPGDAAVRGLIARLDDTHGMVRRKAVFGLRRRKSAETDEALAQGQGLLPECERCKRYRKGNVQRTEKGRTFFLCDDCTLEFEAIAKQKTLGPGCWAISVVLCAGIAWLMHSSAAGLYMIIVTVAAVARLIYSLVSPQPGREEFNKELKKFADKELGPEDPGLSLINEIKGLGSDTRIAIYKFHNLQAAQEAAYAVVDHEKDIVAVLEKKQGKIAHIQFRDTTIVIFGGLFSAIQMNTAHRWIISAGGELDFAALPDNPTWLLEHGPGAYNQLFGIEEKS